MNEDDVIIVQTQAPPVIIRVAEQGPTGATGATGATGPQGPAGPSVWGVITGTLSDQTDLQDALNAKEPTIASGTTGQYWRGDKSWQTLDKAAVGLGSVDNTSDTDKPVSNATQNALNLKANDSTNLGVALWSGTATTATIDFSGGTFAIYRNVSGGQFGSVHIPADLPDGATIYGGICQATGANSISSVMVTRSGLQMTFRYRTISSTASADTSFNAVYRLT